MQSGRVYLVGAGPGDPGLISLRGVQCLQRAELVLYDYLVNPEILEHVPHDAEVVCLGRHGQGRILPQDEINARMVAAAEQGKQVVRLKGGDPSLFARGAEEVGALLQSDIEFEVVPGISAASAAASHAGIPLTHRDWASGVALVTGQERSGKTGRGIDYQALARFPGTVVFFMGVTTAPHWSQALIQAGREPDTPAAVLRRCSLPDQQIVRCTLGEVAEVIAKRQIRPPVLVVVGEVVSLSQGEHWFQRRPLFGQRVLVTRPDKQLQALRNQLRELGAEVLSQPAIRIAPPTDWTPVDQAIRRLPEFEWLVFSSANGVQAFCDRLGHLDLDARQLATTRLAAIGPATATALRSYHLQTDLTPDEYRAEALADALLPHLGTRSCLLVRASRGREVLAERLLAAGAQIEQVVAYQSLDVEDPEPEVARALAAGEIDWTTVTSSAIAQSLVRMFGEALRKTRIASLSPVTSSTLCDLGMPPAVEATEYTTEGLVQAICQARG